MFTYLSERKKDTYFVDRIEKLYTTNDIIESIIWTHFAK